MSRASIATNPHLCLCFFGHRLDGTRPLVQFLRGVLFGKCRKAQNTGDTPHGEAGSRRVLVKRQGPTANCWSRRSGECNRNHSILTVLFEKGWLLALEHGLNMESLSHWNLSASDHSVDVAVSKVQCKTTFINLPCTEMHFLCFSQAAPLLHLWKDRVERSWKFPGSLAKCAPGGEPVFSN